MPSEAPLPDPVFGGFTETLSLAAFGVSVGTGVLVGAGVAVFNCSVGLGVGVCVFSRRCGVAVQSGSRWNDSMPSGITPSQFCDPPACTTPDVTLWLLALGTAALAGGAGAVLAGQAAARRS